MIKIYYIEYEDSIKFFKDNLDYQVSFDMIKNEYTYEGFKKVLKSKKYKFINLIKNWIIFI